MKELEISVKGVRCSYDELDATDRLLVDKARAIAANAYAPYSKFKVGAAILLDNGEIVTGCNQENAAFPSGTCAERTACFYAHAQYPQAKMTKIAIAAYEPDGLEIADPVAPCGACRQALLEYETLAGEGMEVMLVGSKEIFIFPSLKSLLPLAFSEF